MGAVGDVGGVDGAGGTTRPATVPAAARGEAGTQSVTGWRHKPAAAVPAPQRLPGSRRLPMPGCHTTPGRTATPARIRCGRGDRWPAGRRPAARPAGGGGRGKVHRQRVAPGRGPGHEGHHRWGGLCAAEFALLTQGLCHALERQPHKVPTGLSARCAVCSLDEASDRLALVGRRGLRTVRSIRSRLSPFS